MFEPVREVELVDKQNQFIRVEQRGAWELIIWDAAWRLTKNWSHIASSFSIELGHDEFPHEMMNSGLIVSDSKVTLGSFDLCISFVGNIRLEVFSLPMQTGRLSDHKNRGYSYSIIDNDSKIIIGGASPNGVEIVRLDV